MRRVWVREDPWDRCDEVDCEITYVQIGTEVVMGPARSHGHFLCERLLGSCGFQVWRAAGSWVWWICFRRGATWTTAAPGPAQGGDPGRRNPGPERCRSSYGHGTQCSGPPGGGYPGVEGGGISWLRFWPATSRKGAGRSGGASGRAERARPRSSVSGLHLGAPRCGRGSDEEPNPSLPEAGSLGSKKAFLEVPTLPEPARKMACGACVDSASGALFLFGQRWRS